MDKMADITTSFPASMSWNMTDEILNLTTEMYALENENFTQSNETGKISTVILTFVVKIQNNLIFKFKINIEELFHLICYGEERITKPKTGKENRVRKTWQKSTGVGE